MFMRNLSTDLGILALLSLIASPVYSFPIPSPPDLLAPNDQGPYLSRRQNGNSDAAGDLYGIGMRVGVYLQVFGMLLSCLRDEKRSRVGIQLLSSAICL